MPTVIIVVGLLLIAYAIYGTVKKAKGQSKASCCGSKETVVAKPVDDTDESHYPYRYNVAVDGMMCSNCAAHVQNALNKMDGVWARVNLGRHRAEVLAKAEMTEADFAAALKDTDYRVTGLETVSQ